MARGDGRQRQWHVLVLSSVRAPHDRPAQRQHHQSRLDVRMIINRPQTAASYMASKGAVHMLTKALATEWAKSGVRVNALAPGYVAREMTLKMRECPELFNVWLDMTPMGRIG